MKILITTPTERIGRLVVRELLAPEFSVRVIVREPRQLPEEIRSQVEVVSGPMEDAATLQAALAGVEAMFFCVLPLSRWRTDAPNHHYEGFARTAAQAIREARTPRVVTFFSEDQACVPGRSLISDLQTIEAILNKSGAAIRHLHSGLCEPELILPAGPVSGRKALCQQKPKRAVLPPAASDIADAALRWLVRRDWNGVARVAIRGMEEVFPSRITTVAARPWSSQCFWF
ncbi:MAG: NAD(P)H-binding protein [Verrucomicrobiota bacterium]